MNEPSVLDYLKSILNPWSKEKIRIPDGETLPQPGSATETPDVLELQQARDPSRVLTPTAEEGRPAQPGERFRWDRLLPLLAVIAAVFAQLMLEPPDRNLPGALLGYSLAVVLFAAALVIRSEVPEAKAPSYNNAVHIRGTPLLLSVVFGLAAFLAFGSHRFGSINMFFWLAAVGLGVYALWQPGDGLRPITRSVAGFFQDPQLKVTLTPWRLLILASVVLAVFFRFYRLDQVPGEMFSDHAEKLTDVADVLQGNNLVFFPRNTGREAIQMYLTAAVSKVFGTGLSYMSLKIGTALAGFLALPYIYLLGRELGGRWTGLFAFLLAGTAYWPNVISRIGLRFPLYPLFVAPVLYYLIRGLRHARWNDFILAGITLGIGLHGYSPIRFLPFVVTAGVALYLLHPQSRGNRTQVFWGFFALAFVALLLFIPLLRYWFDDPAMFSYRVMTRMASLERDISQPVVGIFFSNLWRAMIMFFWDNGSIWVHSVTGRPALSVVPSALLMLGLVYMVYRYIRRPNWQDLFLVVSIPLLMMPSILSIAFPDENPSLNRTGGAVIPVFIIIALVLKFILSGLSRQGHRYSRVAAVLIAVVLLALTFSQDYDLVFHRFDQQFMANALNTTEMGGVIRDYVDSGMGSKDSAYVVPFPYWVDTRLVGINAGFPDKDYALWPENFASTLGQPGSRLFIIKPEDQQSLLALQGLYPDGWYWLYQSKIPGKEFWVFLVPPQSEPAAILTPEGQEN